MKNFYIHFMIWLKITFYQKPKIYIYKFQNNLISIIKYFNIKSKSLKYFYKILKSNLSYLIFIVLGIFLKK